MEIVICDHDEKKMEFSRMLDTLICDIPRNKVKRNYTIHMTLMMTSAQVVETSVNVTNNSPSRDYSHPDDQTTQTTETPGFKPFTIYRFQVKRINQIPTFQVSHLSLNMFIHNCVKLHLKTKNNSLCVTTLIYSDDLFGCSCTNFFRRIYMLILLRHK